MQKDNIINFINYHYRRLSIKYLIFSNMGVWIISIFIWNADGTIKGMDIFLFGGNIAYLVLCIAFCLLGIHKKTSKFFVEGSFFTYLSIQFTLLSYKILAYLSGRSIGKFFYYFVS